MSAALSHTSGVSRRWRSAARWAMVASLSSPQLKRFAPGACLMNVLSDLIEASPMSSLKCDNKMRRLVSARIRKNGEIVPPTLLAACSESIFRSFSLRCLRWRGDSSTCTGSAARGTEDTSSLSAPSSESSASSCTASNFDEPSVRGDDEASGRGSIWPAPGSQLRTAMYALTSLLALALVLPSRRRPHSPTSSTSKV